MSSSRGETAVVSSPVISPPTTDHMRSPTTPPDLDLSSKNVFAFGLPSYGGFSNGDQRIQSFTPLARNGSLDQPRGYPWSPSLEKSPKQQAKSKSTTHSPAISAKSVPESSPKPSSKPTKHPETTDEEIKVKESETPAYYESERSSSRPRSRSESPNVYVGNHSVQDSDHSDPRDGTTDYYDDGQDTDAVEDQVHLRSEKPQLRLSHRQGHSETTRTDSKPQDRYSTQRRHRSHVSSTASVSEVRSQPYGPSSHSYDRDIMSGSSRIRVDTSAPIHMQSQPQLLLEHTHLVTDMPSPLGTPSSTTASSSEYPYYYPPPSSTAPSHGYLPIPTLHPLPMPYSVGMSGGRGVSTAICKFYAQGHCARGEHCNFAHLATSSPKSIPTGSRSTAHIHHDGDDFSCPTCRAHKPMTYYPSAPHQKPKERYKQKEVRSRQSKHPKQGRSGGSSERYTTQGVSSTMHPQHMHTIGHHVPSSHGQPQPMPMTTYHPHPPPMMQSYDPRTTRTDTSGGRGDRTGYSTHSLVTTHGTVPTSTSITYERERTHGGSFDPSGMDFLSKFSANSSIEQLEGNIYIIAKDQYGCRLLQRMLDEQKPKVVDVTFREVFEHINELMTDPFGNYLCQKLIEHCSESQRLAIIQKVAPDLVAISLNMHGTRAVQKLVETIGNPKDVSFSRYVELVVGALRQSVVTLIKDLNGNHVIQRCLHHLSSKDNQFIYDAVARHCVSVATHKHGCCVLQRCIYFATVTQKRQLVQEIVSNALELVQDAFGNYVVQYVLDLGESSISHGIMANLLGSVSSLSVQKFSSNVVEKCLELADDDMRVRLVEELVNVERLPRLLQDPYANYVIQKALQVSKKAQFERLVAVIKPHLAALRNTSFGKRIQSKIMKKFPDLSPSELSHPSHHLSPPHSHHSTRTSPGGTSRSLLPHHSHPHQSPRTHSEPHERERELAPHHSHSSPLLSRVSHGHDEKISHSHSLPVSGLPSVPLTLTVPLSSQEGGSTSSDPSSKFQSLSLEETDVTPKVDTGSSGSESTELVRSHLTDKKEDTTGDSDTAELDETSEEFTSTSTTSTLMSSKERVLSSSSLPLLPSSSSPSWLWPRALDQSSVS